MADSIPREALVKLITKLKKQNEVLQKRNALLENSEKAVSPTSSEGERKLVAQLREARVAHQNQMQKVQDECDQNRAQLERSQQLVKTLQMEVAEFQARSDRNPSAGDSEVGALTKENGDLKIALERLQEQWAQERAVTQEQQKDVNTSLTRAAERITSLRSELGVATQALAEERSEWKRERSEMQATVTQLKASLESSRAEAIGLKKELEQRQVASESAHTSTAEEIKLRDKAMRDLEHRITQLTGSLEREKDLLARERQLRSEEKEERARELETHERIRERDEQEWESTRKRLVIEVQDLKLQLQEQTASSANAHETAVRQLQEKLQSSESKRQQLQSELNSLQELVEAATRDVQRMAAEVSDAKQRSADAESQLAAVTARLESQAATQEQKSSEKYERVLRELKVVKDNAADTIETQTKRVQELQQRVLALEDEVENGAGAERRILELAKMQASKEEEVERHKLVTQDLKDQLVECEEVIKRQDQQKRFLAAEIMKLQRTRKRARVDLDYLKNVLVRLMQFDEKADERHAIYPVLATILHFGPEDIRMIEKAAPHLRYPADNSWWATISGAVSAIVPYSGAEAAVENTRGMTLPNTTLPRSSTVKARIATVQQENADDSLQEKGDVARTLNYG